MVGERADCVSVIVVTDLIPSSTNLVPPKVLVTTNKVPFNSAITFHFIDKPQSHIVYTNYKV